MKLSKLFCIVLLIEFFKVGGLAAGGDVLWENPFKVGFFNPSTNVLVSGQRLFVAGYAVRFDAQANAVHSDGFLNAYNISSGAPVWSKVWGLPAPFFDFVVGLGMSNQALFVAGYSDGEDGNGGTLPRRTFLRKYDPQTGNLLWEKRVGGQLSGQSYFASSMAVIEGKVFVSGGVSSEAIGGQGFTRAYSTTNGALLWERRETQSSAGPSVADGNRVFVAGAIGSYPNYDSIVRAYDASSGAKLWEKVIAGKDYVKVMKVAGTQLFIAGGSSGESYESLDFYVLACKVDSGKLLWQDDPKKSGADWINDMTVSNQKVYVCGSGTNAAGSQDFLVRAYDAASGRLLWKNLLDKGGADEASGLAANPSLGLLFVIGSGEVAPNSFNHRPLLRAYNMNTGGPIWENFSDDGTGSDNFGSLIVSAGETVLTTGIVNAFDDAGQGWPAGDLVVTAYDAK
jgi:outer membrane protein assembly factor BamB